MEKLLTIEEASALMRQPVATLRFWRHVGKGPQSAKLGARVFYREADCVDWVNEQFRQPAA